MPSADRLERLTNQLVNMAEADMVVAIEASEGAYGTSRLVVVAFAVGSILLALALGYIISWSLIEPVKKIETRLSQIAAGDFAQHVAVANRDELGVLAANVNQTSDQLGRLYQEIETRTQQLDEALQQQTATADVLKVISRSTFDLQVVLDTLVESAVRLCRADKGGIVQLLDGAFRYVSTHGYPPTFRAYVDANPLPALAAGRGSAVGRVIEERRIVQIEDVTADPDYRVALIAEAGGFRTVLAAPLLREGDRANGPAPTFPARAGRRPDPCGGKWRRALAEPPSRGDRCLLRFARLYCLRRDRRTRRSHDRSCRVSFLSW
ncbi:HAMP domain-containing protein [Mesorhizobium sp. M0500]|uniref:HAMP domain-containing protein n=1 Tax=Mesorhizobium sp. M0500 TaxID=2956953 RepID=UPI003337374A